MEFTITGSVSINFQMHGTLTESHLECIKNELGIDLVNTAIEDINAVQISALRHWFEVAVQENTDDIIVDEICNDPYLDTMIVGYADLLAKR
jgi:hypothetical protein